MASTYVLSKTFCLSWLSHPPRIAEDDTIYAKRKKWVQGGQAGGSEKERDGLLVGRHRNAQARNRMEWKGAGETDIQIQRKEREAVRVGGFVEGKLVDLK